MNLKKSRATAYLLMLAACGLIVISGCGKKAPPKPPVEKTAPEKK